jgi:outer membrane lipoprotein SlyB
MKRQFDEQAARNQVRPEKSAEEMHNDRQVFIGLINGVLIGGVLSGVGGYLAKWSVITICFAVLGGVVVGGLIGAMITRLVLWMNSRKEKPASPDKNNQTHI